jgi:D-alanine-D-alanine ligase
MRAIRTWHLNCTRASDATVSHGRKDRMVRIGFAYNVKPDASAAPTSRPTDASGGEDSEAPLAEEEPPSNGTSVTRSRRARDLRRAEPAGPILLEEAAADDEFAEWDTWETISAVSDALSPFGEVVHLEATLEFPARLQATRPDIVFNIAEGRGGKNRESLVPAICEYLDVPYTGSDPLTLSLCLDKGRTKEVLSYYRVPTPAFAVIERAADVGSHFSRLRYPLFVKPVHEGSSKGITERNFCRTPVDLASQVNHLIESYDQPVLVEEFLPGAEYTCAVLGNGPRARVLPIVGMNFDALPEGAIPVYGFEAKWVWDRPDSPLEIFDCPAHMAPALRRAVESTSLRAYHALGCRDWARIDVRLDAEGTPNVIEVNPLPGILPDPADNSCFPKAARAAGMSYEQLIQSCLTSAGERYGMRLPRILP